MSPPADLLITDGRLFRAYGPTALTPYGSDIGPRPVAAATAIAVRDGSIAWIGRDDEARRDWMGPLTQHVDARGGLITAGFDDAHIHLVDGAIEADRVDLFGLASVEAIRSAIAGHARSHPDDAWVLGRGWQYGAFPGGLPTRGLLDSIVADRPAFMGCYDGHTGWANGPALRLAGIDRGSADPAGGTIVRDPTTGEPTGVLKEDAQELVLRHIPTPTPEMTLAAMRRTIGELHAAGITSIQDAWVEPDQLDLWRALRDDGTLRLRARLALPMQPDGSLTDWQATLDGYRAAVIDLADGPWLTSGVLKAFADGVIEARTAALLDPYIDDDASGEPVWEPDQLDAFVAEADRRGWQLEIHAIGDGAIRMVLDSYERAAAGGPAPAHGRRHRVEHIETVTRADIPRFGALGVVASMQPYHADPSPNQTDVWAGNLGAERAGQAWSWASIRRDGGVVALGSDWPVVPFDPMLALHTAVNRQTVAGHPAGGWLPSEKLSLPDALAAYGHGSAFAAFAEDHRGTLRVGADADIVVLDRDILAGGPSSIIGTRAVITVVGGQVVHRSEAST
jgi:predicted amidohydrolase YtcJ